jgi:hypothetical protein
LTLTAKSTIILSQQTEHTINKKNHGISVTCKHKPEWNQILVENPLGGSPKEQSCLIELPNIFLCNKKAFENQSILK